MSLQTKVIGRQPTDHGPYDPNLAYGKKFQCTLFGCAWESLHDNNNTAPAVWDGGDTITPNLVDWKKVSGSYEAWLMNHDKPATSEQYPYNGMGRIRLQKNIVNGVNTLTQAMLTQTNTIYVIQYDFTLGEDITIPDNCILEFDGGSIKDGKITSDDAVIVSDKKCFNNITFEGKLANHGTAKLDWFISAYPKDTNDISIDNSDEFQAAVDSGFLNILVPTDKFIHLTKKINIIKPVNLLTEGRTKFNVETHSATEAKQNHMQPCIFSKNQVTLFDYELQGIVDNTQLHLPLTIGSLNIFIDVPYSSVTEETTKIPIIKIIPQAASSTLWGIVIDANIVSIPKPIPVAQDEQRDGYPADNCLNYTGIYISSEFNAISMVKINGYIYGLFYGVYCTTNNGEWFTDLKFNYDSWCIYGAYVYGYPHPVIITGSHQSNGAPAALMQYDNYFQITTAEVSILGFVWDLGTENLRSKWTSAKSAAKSGFNWLKETSSFKVPIISEITTSFYQDFNRKNLLYDALFRGYYVKNLTVEGTTSGNVVEDLLLSNNIINRDLLFDRIDQNRGAISILNKCDIPHTKNKEYTKFKYSFIIDRSVYVIDPVKPLYLYTCFGMLSSSFNKCFINLKVSGASAIDGTYTERYNISNFKVDYTRIDIGKYYCFNLKDFYADTYVKIEFEINCINGDAASNLPWLYIPSYIDFDVVKAFPSDNLPTLASFREGVSVWDATNNKPIYWTGTAWVDATGNQV